MILNRIYYLGDGENYFKYREDKYNSKTIRADLFNQNEDKISTLLVKGGMTNENYDHAYVINYFELVVDRKL